MADYADYGRRYSAAIADSFVLAAAGKEVPDEKIAEAVDWSLKGIAAESIDLTFRRVPDADVRAFQGQAVSGMHDRLREHGFATAQAGASGEPGMQYHPRNQTCRREEVDAQALPTCITGVRRWNVTAERVVSTAGTRIHGCNGVRSVDIASAIPF